MTLFSSIQHMETMVSITWNRIQLMGYKQLIRNDIISFNLFGKQTTIV